VFVSQLKARKLGCFARTRIPRQKIQHTTSQHENEVVTETGVTQPDRFSTIRSLITVRQHTCTRRMIVVCLRPHGVVANHSSSKTTKMRRRLLLVVVRHTSETATTHTASKTTRDVVSSKHTCERHSWINRTS